MSRRDALELFKGRRLPIVIGAEAAECGLACMTMISRWHGHDVDLNGPRQRSSRSISGASLRTLMQMADRLGLRSRANASEFDAVAVGSAANAAADNAIAIGADSDATGDNATALGDLAQATAVNATALEVFLLRRRSAGRCANGSAFRPVACWS